MSRKLYLNEIRQIVQQEYKELPYQLTRARRMFMSKLVRLSIYVENYICDVLCWMKSVVLVFGIKQIKIAIRLSIIAISTFQISGIAVAITGDLPDKGHGYSGFIKNPANSGSTHETDSICKRDTPGSPSVQWVSHYPNNGTSNDAGPTKMRIDGEGKPLHHR
jgi:hypothetical protein